MWLSTTTAGIARVDNSSAVDHSPDASPFRHEALLYESDDTFFDGTMSFIHEGLSADEPVLVILNAAKNDVLRDRLGADARRVDFADMAAVGANPAWIIPAWREFANRCLADGRPFRGIGEPISKDRNPHELVECQRHEALLNLAFAGTVGFRLMCPYDMTSLAPDVLAEAHRTHPSIVEGTQHRVSNDYRDIDDVAAPFDTPLPEPPAVLAELTIERETLGLLRRTVASHAVAVGLTDTRVDELVFAANEVATNSLVHGGGQGILRLWRDTSSIVCEVRDTGRITDPLAGRVAPPENAFDGRGLWLSTQLCDLVQIRALDGGGIVRLHMRAN